MKIETLISKLQDLQKEMPEAEIRLNDHHGDELLFVVALSRNSDLMPPDIANVVWLEGEHDNDMTELISEYFKSAVDEFGDELDVYMEMIELGIDVDMVRRYTDDETADHMEKFCKEHGLI